uniref:FAD dependent oxidoreductase domain-containing protein n=1 Tax=Salmo trutta TaxID=8032 RepID=A0A673XIJ1_SALTR
MQITKLCSARAKPKRVPRGGPRTEFGKPWSTSAEAVVIGGGSLGCQTVYHLAKMANVVMLERDRLPAGTNWHTAGRYYPLPRTLWGEETLVYQMQSRNI